MTSTSTAVGPHPSHPTRAERFAALHASGCFVLPTVWDGLSATLAAQAGAQAIGTSSGAVAWSLGRPDGERIEIAALLRVVEIVCTAVDVPVSVDVERGFGRTPAEVTASVGRIAAAGAVGINLEDSSGRDSGAPLTPVGTQAQRIAAAASVTTRDGRPLHVSARTDVWLHPHDPDEALTETLRRAKAYAEAGAASLFVPGCTDLMVLARLAASSSLPVNAMAGAAATGRAVPGVAAYAAAGVRRVSLGTALAEDAYGRARSVLASLLRDGELSVMRRGVDYTEVNALLARRWTTYAGR